MIKHLLLTGTVLFSLSGCAARFTTTHFDRWAKEDLARRSEAPAVAPAPAASSTEAPASSTPMTAPPTPAETAAPPTDGGSDYPDAASSGTTGPDTSSEGRVVRPQEEDEVLY